MTEKTVPVLYLVSPCYNEQEVLLETGRRLLDKLSGLIEKNKISPKSRILLVNDGSRDKTWEIIRNLHDADARIQGVSLSRNQGHQNALLAGLMTAKDRADIVISLDADLQDDIDAIDEMVRKYCEEDCDVVYGVRKKRSTDTAFKKFTAEGFYKLVNILGGEIVYNHADYRLLSRRALEGLAEFSEVNLFLRGIVPMVGFKSDIVYYDRQERVAGESHYPLGKMLSFAVQGVTSLTVRPIRLIAEAGLALFLLSMFVLFWSIFRWYQGDTIAGWTSIVVSIWANGGLVLLSLGVIGEYIGKIYLESKHRPRYIIDEYLQ
ncbi:glycosyltransferase family 2 protein [Selenomonas sp. AB3002]|uniref:glycosyltransferase family 2 protein n=1 Tax=Selenomonas sp. AB3002 TaxID=1392502 RepID=UPI0004973859